MGLRADRYEEFWKLYLREHSKPLTRALHITGTLIALGLVVVGLATMSWQSLIAAPVVGYALAWIAHFFVEHNTPATMSHPWWSLVSDLRMVVLFLRGRLGSELERAVPHPGTAPDPEESM